MNGGSQAFVRERWPSVRQAWGQYRSENSSDDHTGSQPSVNVVKLRHGRQEGGSLWKSKHHWLFGLHRPIQMASDMAKQGDIHPSLGI